MNKVYDDIESMLCRELENIARKGELTSSSLDIIGKITDANKDISIYKAMEHAGYSEAYPTYVEDGVSYGRPVYRGGSYRGSYDGSYDGGSYDGSYDDGRGRGRNAQRDSMGRYSSEGYSGHMDEAISKLHQMMNQSTDPQEKQTIQRIINQMQQPK